MRISNQTVRIKARRSESWLEALGAGLSARLAPGAYPLRLSISSVAEGHAAVETTVVESRPHDRYAASLEHVEFFAPRRAVPAAATGPFVVAQIVPTGIRCEIGGYAGDACPATNLLAAAADVVVTHPNAVNASELNEMAPNVLYVEGKSLDDFLLGHLGLLPSRANRIGTVVDVTGREFLPEVVNVLDAARTAAGIDCGRYVVSNEEFGVGVEWSDAGCAVGTIGRPEALLDGVEALLELGVDALGGVSVIHGVTEAMVERHLAGAIPNPSGGVEAIVTHLLSKLFRLPCAHAPLPYYHRLKPREPDNPRSAAEFISTPHYFSVLKGLARAPRLVSLADLDRVPARALTLNDLGAIVVPASSLGGIPALAAEFSGIPLIAVAENRTILDVTNRRMQLPNVIEVRSYLEAAGAVLALRQGISLESLRRPVAESTRVALGREALQLVVERSAVP
jgi:hypothetical protein